MTLVADPIIEQTYLQVRDDKEEINWMILTFVDDKKDVLEVSASGTGGLKEFKTHLKPELAAFGYIRIPLMNDEYSERTKFLFVSYCGDRVKVMRKAKLSIQKEQVKQIVQSFSIEMNADNPSDLDENEVMLRLKRAGGANYDRQSSNY